MEKKIDKLRAYMDAGEWGKALRLAASWPRLGDAKQAIQLGWAAHSNPGFYRQIKKDPEALVATGIKALVRRYRLPLG